MHRVYGSEAMQDPTAIETKVSKEMAERTERHHTRNQERKKTKEQRRDKKKRKLIEDTMFTTNVSVYKVLELSTLNRYKVDMNSQQNYLTGCCIIGPSFSLVVVEGGPKGMKRYKKLMLRRIKWNPDEEETVHGSDEDNDKEKEKEKEKEKPDGKTGDENQVDAASKTKNRCDLIWEGEVLQAAFNDFQMKVLRSELQVRKFLTDRGCIHYWDMAKNFIPPVTNNIKF